MTDHQELVTRLREFADSLRHVAPAYAEEAADLIAAADYIERASAETPVAWVTTGSLERAASFGTVSAVLSSTNLKGIGPTTALYTAPPQSAIDAAYRRGFEDAAQVDYFGSLVQRARAAAAKASVKYPQPNYVALKIAEEAGEVVRGAVHYAENRMEWEEVEGEIVQLIAMLIRFVTEGDQINGVTPPAAIRAKGV